MNKWLGVTAAVVLVGLAVLGAVLWGPSDDTRPVAPQPSPTTEAASQPVTRSAGRAVELDPVPVPDLGEQTAQLQAYLGTSGRTGAIHQAVSAEADAAQLVMRDRLWLHSKVDRYLSAVAEYQDQVAAGDMSAADAATNAEEDLLMLSERLAGRTPEVADAVVEVLAQ